jgi:hypothetical protein
MQYLCSNVQAKLHIAANWKALLVVDSRATTYIVCRTDIMRSTTCFAAALIICTNLDLVSGQNVAGKFAARTKLSDASSSKKKKRSFWVSRKNNAAEDEENKDGECSWTKEGIRNCWWWHLFLAQSEIIIKSVGISVLCAVVSWLWYLRSQYYVDEDEDRDKEENKGEFQPLSLFGVANTVHSHPLWSRYLQLKTSSVIILSN